MPHQALDTNATSSIPVITDNEELLRYGICRVPLPTNVDWNYWARELSQVTPEIMFGQGDGEYSFYRNIMEEEEFPFDCILDISVSEIGRAILKHFPVLSPDELVLDDAFCVHYNTSQEDTTGAKHMDPSDITVNLCLEKSLDTKGSHVLFYGTKSLQNVNNSNNHSSKDAIPDQFFVSQLPGTATIHFGDHPHETIALEQGTRTNIVMTYCYKDPSRSRGQTRSCYF